MPRTLAGHRELDAVRRPSDRAPAGARSRRATGQFCRPVECVAHDEVEVEVVEFRTPFECRAVQVGGGHDLVGIARPTVCEADLEDAKAPRIAAVHNDRIPAAPQIEKRVGVGFREIPVVNAVTHEAAVRRWVVGAVDVKKNVSLALGCL